MAEEKLVAEVVPDQVLPKVLTTFGLVAIYVFIIYFITGSSIISTAGWASLPMWILGFLMLAFGTEANLTTSILLQLAVLWLAVVLALRRLSVTQRMMYIGAGIYTAVCVAVFVTGLVHAGRDGSAVPVTRDIVSVDFSN